MTEDPSGSPMDSHGRPVMWWLQSQCRGRHRHWPQWEEISSMRSQRLLSALAAAALLAVPAPAMAHHPDDDQHGGTGGHLPPVNRNVELVGKAKVTNPSGAGLEGRVADVTAFGNYAYLTAFRSPTCEKAGVHVMDIHDPAHPAELTGAFIPTSVGSYAGEGIQVVHLDTAAFTGDLLIHQNETCPGGVPAPPSPDKAGGISLWNVTDPTHPTPVALHQGDFTNPSGGTDPGPNQTHSMWAWHNEFNDRWYVVLVDDEEETDVDILDITDPRPDKVTLVAESDYALVDEEQAKLGHTVPPEGNAHQSELSANNKFLLATDEDFNPYAVTGTIGSGPNSGYQYRAASGSATPPIAEGTEITGAPTFVGLACSALPAGTGVALVERGGCTFQAKLDNIKAAGYSAGIVFNSVRADCASLVSMLASGGIPFVFVSRESGLRLLNQTVSGEGCTQASPAAGAAAADNTIKSVFDGWGYVRLFATDIPGRKGQPGSISQIDTFAVPEAQDPAYASGYGALSVHEVAIDPDRQLVYLSYYAAGFRVLTYGKTGLHEVGAFIDEGGNDFWGVEIWHDSAGQKYVLASDRDYGLYIFRYTGPLP